MCDNSLEQINESSKAKYQRLPIRTIYEEISVLDSFDDTDALDLPLLFIGKNEYRKIRMPIDNSILKLRGKSDIQSIQEKHDKKDSRNMKRNSQPTNIKSMSMQSSNKNSFCFLSSEKLKKFLDHNWNRKKLVQAETMHNNPSKKFTINTKGSFTKIYNTLKTVKHSQPPISKFKKNSISGLKTEAKSKYKENKKKKVLKRNVRPKSGDNFILLLEKKMNLHK